MGSLYKLITKTNLKSPVIAFPIIMPLIFILLYSTQISSGIDSTAEIDRIVSSFYVTLIAIGAMQSGLMGFGLNFMNIKKSVLLRRIGSTKLTKTDIITAVLLYGLTLFVIQFIWIFIVMGLFAASGLFYSIDGASTSGMYAWTTYISWGKLFVALIMMLMVSYSLGLLVASWAKDETVYQGTVSLYFFMASFMSGLLFPGAIPDWMTYFGYIVPHAYVGDLFNWASGMTEIGANVGWSQWAENMDPATLDTIPQILEISNVKFAFDFIVPIAFTGIFMTGAIKLLKFE